MCDASLVWINLCNIPPGFRFDGCGNKETFLVCFPERMQQRLCVEVGRRYSLILQPRNVHFGYYLIFSLFFFGVVSPLPIYLILTFSVGDKIPEDMKRLRSFAPKKEGSYVATLVRKKHKGVCEKETVGRF